VDSVINELLRHIELFVLGALGVMAVTYFLALVHPVKESLTKYVGTLRSFWLGELSNDNALLKTIDIAVIVGALYYMGVLANSASYWLVEPARFRILESIYADKLNVAANCPGNVEKPIRGISTWEAVKLPLTRMLPGGETQRLLPYCANNLYLNDEAGTNDLKAEGRVHDALSSELISIRLLRGTAVIAIAVFAACLFKLLVLLITAFLWPWSDAWYKTLIKWDAEPGTHDWREKVKTAWTCVVLPQLVILVLSGVFYYVAMGSYRTTEFEYSHLVRTSVEHRNTAPEQKKQTHAALVLRFKDIA